MRKLMLVLLCIAASSVNWVDGAEKGYKGAVEVGFVGADRNRGEISMVNGYRFNSWLSAGIGVGFQFWQVTQDVTLPVFLDLEAAFLDGRIAPFADVRTGYSFGLSTLDYLPLGGVYFNPSVGFRWRISGKKALRLSAGYLVQGSKSLQNYGTRNEFSEQIFFHGLVARVGFEF